MNIKKFCNTKMVNRLKAFFLHNSSTKQTIVKNFFWLSSSQVGSRLIRAAILIYAIRILGASEYGIFSYVLGVAGFFTIFADMGLSALLTREVAGNHREKSGIYFSNAFLLKIIFLFFWIIFAILFFPISVALKKWNLKDI